MENEENTTPSEEGTGRTDEKATHTHGDAPPKKSKDILVPVIIGVCLVPIALYITIELFKLVGQPFGIGTEYCYEDNFWISSLNGLLISLALVVMFPAIFLLGNGLVRVIYKRPWGYRAILAGLIFLPFNTWLAWETYLWYPEREWSTVENNGIQRLEELARAQDMYKNDHGAYAGKVEDLQGEYGFSERGLLEITSSNSECYTARAYHECLLKDLTWDSCNGNLQED